MRVYVILLEKNIFCQTIAAQMGIDSRQEYSLVSLSLVPAQKYKLPTTLTTTPRQPHTIIELALKITTTN